ncbi:MAG: hypothetical protein JRF46_14475 [Deltaproteobacteria bacterium]|nr:hypothetical protein [Deltaproteobacteria bacterium]
MANRAGRNASHLPAALLASLTRWSPTGKPVGLHEEDEDADRVCIDEGTIRLGGIEETHNLYFVAGKYYPHFGELNSWFISDPLTLQLAIEF